MLSNADNNQQLNIVSDVTALMDKSDISTGSITLEYPASLYEEKDSVFPIPSRTASALLLEKIDDYQKIWNDDTIPAELRAVIGDQMKKTRDCYIAQQFGKEPNIWSQPSTGLYCCKVLDANGKKKTITGKTEEILREKLFDHFTGESKQMMDTLFTEMLRWKMTKKERPMTAKTASEYTRLWKKYYRPIHRKNLKAISVSQWIRLYEDIVHDHGLDTKAFNTMFAIVNNIMSYAIHMGYINVNPIRDLKEHDFGIIKKPYNTVKTPGFTEEQEQKVIEWCHQALLNPKISPIYPLLLLFQLITGTRVGECRGLTWEDIDFNHRIAVINKQTTNGIQFDIDKKKTTYRGNTDIDHIKGYEHSREIGLSDDAISILQQVRALHLDDTKVFPIRYITYNDKVKLAAEYANCDPKQFHTHSLRVTRGTDIYNQCGDIAVTQVILGHTTPQMTRKYIKDHEIKAKARELMLNNNYSTPTQPPVSGKEKPQNH